MKIDIRYIAFLALLVILYVVLDANMPRKYNWAITFYHQDKNPFGAVVLDELLEKAWKGRYSHSNTSLYFIDSVHADNLLVLCDEFKTGKEETTRFLHWVKDGGNALIGTHQFDSLFADTLGFGTNAPSFAVYAQNLWQNDSMGIHFGRSGEKYYFPQEMIAGHFVRYDTAKTTVIASDENNNAVAIGMRFGKGRIVLTTIPLAFSNYGLLKNHDEAVASGLLSYLPPGSLQRTEYYQLGLMESMSPFRYLLSDPALTWAFYLSCLAILTFFIFGAKRAERIIPVIPPLRNTSVEFIQTVGRLYFHRADHRDLALKKILYFTENLKRNFYIRPDAPLEEMARKVAAKTGSDVPAVQKLFEKMHQISRAGRISKQSLKTLCNEIDKLNEKMTSNLK